jgi:hypothetical protein
MEWWASSSARTRSTVFFRMEARSQKAPREGGAGTRWGSRQRERTAKTAPATLLERIELTPTNPSVARRTTSAAAAWRAAKASPSKPVRAKREVILGMQRSTPSAGGTSPAATRARTMFSPLAKPAVLSSIRAAAAALERTKLRVAWQAS